MKIGVQSIVVEMVTVSKDAPNSTVVIMLATRTSVLHQLQYTDALWLSGLLPRKRLCMCEQPGAIGTTPWEIFPSLDSIGKASSHLSMTLRSLVMG